MLKVVVTTDLTRLPSQVRSSISERFERWSFDGHAEIFITPPSTTELPVELFHKCNAIITRPTDIAKIDPTWFENFKKEVRIYTASVGTDHLRGFKSDKKFQIQDTKPLDNARGVASCNIWMANTLFGNIQENIDNINNGEFINTTIQTTLAGKTWLLLGSGEQVARIIELGISSGIKKFIIYNNRLTDEKFRDCFKYISTIAPSSLRLKGKSGWIAFHHAVGGQECNRIDLEGISNDEDLRNACGVADIVSVHMDLTMKDSPDGRPATAGFVSEKLLACMDSRPILLNTARGALIDEVAVLRALKDDKLRGVGVDVLSSQVESSFQCSQSPLWRERRSNQKLKNRILITPHIAGAVDTDLLAMWHNLLDKLQAQIDRRA